MLITTWLNECKCKNRFCKQGFDDALRFLQQRGLITCTLCMTVESFYQLGIISDNWTRLFACQPIQYFRYRTWRVFTMSGAEWVHKRLSSSWECLASVWQSSGERGTGRGREQGGQRLQLYWGSSPDQSFLFDVPSGAVVDESNQVYLLSLFFPATG